MIMFALSRVNPDVSSEFCPRWMTMALSGDPVARSAVREARCAEDCASRLVVMNIAGDRSVELFDRLLIDPGAGLLANPLFELRIGRTFPGDERDHGVAIQTETVDDHLIEAVANRWVARCEFIAGVERDL